MKTTVDIDKDLAAEAAGILGTGTLKDTVDAALREVVRHELRRELADDIRAGRLSVPTPQELTRSKRPKVGVGALDGIDKVLERRPRRRPA